MKASNVKEEKCQIIERGNIRQRLQEVASKPQVTSKVKAIVDEKAQSASDEHFEETRDAPLNI